MSLKLKQTSQLSDASCTLPDAGQSVAVIRLETVVVLDVGSTGVLHGGTDCWAFVAHRQNEVGGTVLDCG